MNNYAYTANQSKAISFLHGNVRVIAGAGSGKTKVLVKRYLYILGDNYADDPIQPDCIIDQPPKSSGHQIEASQILAITFTEKAGKEMSERIYARLAQLVANTSDKEYWQQCTSDMATAHVGTMHSLYSKIIRENPIESGIESNFTLLSSLNEEYEQKTFKTEYINKLLKNRNEQFALLYRDYTLPQISDLLDFIVHIANNLPADYNEFYHFFIANLDSPCHVSEAANALYESLQNTFSPENIEELRKKNTKSNNALLRLLEYPALFSCTNIDEYLQLLTQHAAILQEVCGALRTNLKIGGELKKSYQLLVQEQLLLAVNAKAQETLPALTELLFDYLRSWRKYKQYKNLLTFDDTEQLCLKLLKDHPDVLAKYQRRYAHVLIDEVQDLSNTQHQIIELLTARPETVLFSVGDKKQSIYGFRGSSIHADTQAEETIALDTNFRSQAGIINTCNEFFDNFTALQSNNVQFDRLRPHRTADLDNVLTAFFEKNYTNELDYLSKYILHLWQTQDISLEDIAILVRTNSQTELICQYLEKHHIPYRVSGRNGFFQDQYIQDLLNLLTCVNNKYAQIELIAILRSPFFAISDQTITNLYVHGNLWEALADEQCRTACTQSELLERAYMTISTLSAQSKYLPISELLREIMYTHNWQNIALLHGDSLQNLSNLNKFVELVGDFEEEHSPYIAEFIEYITTLKENLSSEEMPNVADSKHLGVSIMSIHKSKGLEFSYVFLPQLQKISTVAKGGNRIYQLDSSNAQIGLKFFIESSGKHEPSSIFTQIRDSNRLLDEYESLRILYVAMTRARDQLILLGTRTSSKEGSLTNALEWLSTCLPKDIKQLDIAALDDTSSNIIDTLQTLNEQVYQATLSNCAPLCNISAPALDSISASALHDYQLCPLLFKYKHIASLPDLGHLSNTDNITIGSNSTLLGTLVHAHLEHIGSIQELDLRELLPKEMPDDEQQNLISKSLALFYKYLESPTHKSIRDYIYKQEYSFNYYDHELGILLNGIVDCVLLLPDNTLGIIDYKTGSQLDTYMEFYKLQIALYARVLQRIFHKQVSYMAIHHIGESIKKITISAKDCDSCQLHLTEMLQEIKSNTATDNFSANIAHCKLCTFSYLCKQAHK